MKHDENKQENERDLISGFQQNAKEMPRSK